MNKKLPKKLNKFPLEDKIQKDIKDWVKDIENMGYPMPGVLIQPGHPVDGVNHPAHYGGENNPYEAIKVIEAWNLDFHLGNTVKYISRAGIKPGESQLKDLKKALWYLERKIKNLEK